MGHCLNCCYRTLADKRCAMQIAFCSTKPACNLPPASPPSTTNTVLIAALVSPPACFCLPPTGMRSAASVRCATPSTRACLRRTWPTSSTTPRCACFRAGFSQCANKLLTPQCSNCLVPCRLGHVRCLLVMCFVPTPFVVDMNQLERRACWRVTLLFTVGAPAPLPLAGQDSIIMADTTFVGLLESLLPRCPSVRHVVLLTGGLLCAWASVGHACECTGPTVLPC